MRTGFSCSSRQAYRRLHRRKEHDIAKNLKCGYVCGYVKVSDGRQITEVEILYSEH